MKRTEKKLEIVQDVKSDGKQIECILILIIASFVIIREKKPRKTDKV